MKVHETTQLEMPSFRTDVDDLHRAFANAHIPIDRYDVEQCVERRVEGRRYYYVEDPAGYIYEVNVETWAVTRKL
jgi:hypothetical protein